METIIYRKTLPPLEAFQNLTRVYVCVRACAHMCYLLGTISGINLNLDRTSTAPPDQRPFLMWESTVSEIVVVSIQAMLGTGFALRWGERLALGRNWLEYTFCSVLVGCTQWMDVNAMSENNPSCQSSRLKKPNGIFLLFHFYFQQSTHMRSLNMNVDCCEDYTHSSSPCTLKEEYNQHFTFVLPKFTKCFCMRINMTEKHISRCSLIRKE